MPGQCARCQEQVYYAEEKLAIGKIYHKKCFQCSSCSRSLDSATCTPHGDELYCNSCYSKNFRVSGCGLVVPPEPSHRSNIDADTYAKTFFVNKSYGKNIRAKLDSYPRKQQYGVPVWGELERCKRCEKVVYHAEKMMGAGALWHKSCFSCLECHKSLQSTNVTDRDGEIYCRGCYNKHFAPKGYGFGGGGGGVLQTAD